MHTVWRDQMYRHNTGKLFSLGNRQWTEENGSNRLADMQVTERTCESQI